MDEIRNTKRALFEERISNHLDNIWPLVKQIDNSSRTNRASPIISSSGIPLSTDIAEAFISTYSIRSMNYPLSHDDRTEVCFPARASVATITVEGPAPPQITLEELINHIRLFFTIGATSSNNIQNLVL